MNAAAPPEVVVNAAVPLEVAPDTAVPSQVNVGTAIPLEAAIFMPSPRRRKWRKRRKASPVSESLVAPELPALSNMVTEAISMCSALPALPKLPVLLAPPKWVALPVPPILHALPALPKRLTLSARPKPSAKLGSYKLSVLSCAHYIRCVSLGAVIFVGFPFLTLIPVLSESDLLVLPKLPSLPTPLEFPTLLAPLKFPVLLVPLKLPAQSVPVKLSDLLTPPFPVGRTSDPLEPVWSIPPTLPLSSAKTPDLLEPPWSVPLILPWFSAGVPDWPEPPGLSLQSHTGFRPGLQICLSLPGSSCPSLPPSLSLCIDLFVFYCYFSVMVLCCPVMFLSCVRCSSLGTPGLILNTGWK